jgi:RNA polymerase sigma-70 factor (ECF subfamily)
MFWETAVAGRPPDEVAQEMGTTKWAVYKARARILHKLRQELEELL